MGATGKPPPRNNTAAIERTFDKVSRLFDRVIHERWDHRALGRLSSRGAFDDDEEPAETTSTPEPEE